MFKPSTKFLVADDFSTMRRIIKKVLSDLGYTNAVDAINGQEAYDLLVEHSQTSEPFEFVIVDWNMPIMTGIEFLKKCRADERFKKIPIMFVTAESEESQILEAMNEGVTEYVTKPFTVEKIQEKLENSYKKTGLDAGPTT